MTAVSALVTMLRVQQFDLSCWLSAERDQAAARSSQVALGTQLAGKP